jgi:hypothetical protein
VLSSIGLQCSLCHSTVDDSLAPGIGHRLDGWANRDLNVGAIIALAPDLTRGGRVAQLGCIRHAGILRGRRRFLKSGLTHGLAAGHEDRPTAAYFKVSR